MAILDIFQKPRPTLMGELFAIAAEADIRYQASRQQDAVMAESHHIMAEGQAIAKEHGFASAVLDDGSIFAVNYYYEKFYFYMGTEALSEDEALTAIINSF